MSTTNSRPINLSRRGFSKTSLLLDPNSSKINSNSVKVLRLDIDELTGGNVQSRNSLIRLLDRTVTGQDAIFTSPIANNALPDDIYSGWDRIYEQNKSKINSILDRIEMSNRDKKGPRSIAKPWSERKEKIYSSFGKGGTYNLLVPNLGINKRLRPLTIEEASKYLKNSTNSGLPFMMRKSLVKDDVLRDFATLYGKYPAVLFTRTQEGGKTRDVWGYPIADTLFEMRFYRPILTHQIKQPWRAALRNPRSLDEAVNKLMSNNKQRGQYIVSGDVSGFDDDVKESLQEKPKLSVINCYQEQFHDDLEVCFDRFTTIPIVTPDGILSGSHGIPSGSTWTNEFGSIAQFSIFQSCGCVSMDDIQLQGDDSISSTSDPDVIFESFGNAGLRINPDKSDVSDEYCTFLQFLYHPDYRTGNLIGGVYSTYRALNRIIYLESFDDISKEDISGKDYFAIRTISILENCKHHPLFKELVKYVWSLDKYKLNVSDLGLRQFVRIKREQEGKDITFSNYTYGDDIEGIKSFETFKILRELNI